MFQQKFKKHEKHQNLSFSILFLKNDLKKWLWMTNIQLNELHVSALKSTHVLELLISLPDNNTNPVSVFSLQSDSLPWQIFSNSIKASSATWIAVLMNEVDLYTRSESYLCLTTTVKLRCIIKVSSPTQ